MADKQGVVKLDMKEEDFGYLSFPGNELRIETPNQKMKRFVRENPLVLVGLVGTVGVLLRGIQQMVRGNSRKSNIMMRWRVAMQGFTVLALIGGGVYHTQKRMKEQENLDRLTNKPT